MNILIDNTNEKANAFCTSKFWLWLTEKRKYKLVLTTTEAGHPLTQFSVAGKPA